MNIKWKLNNMLHRKDVSRKDIFSKAEKDWISQNIRKATIEGLLTYLKLPAETEKKSYEDIYKRLNGTISPYKAKSTERAVRNETGIHVDYISMMAVFYKILFNGHYMDI